MIELAFILWVLPAVDLSCDETYYTPVQGVSSVAVSIDEENNSWLTCYESLTPVGTLEESPHTGEVIRYEHF